MGVSSNARRLRTAVKRRFDIASHRGTRVSCPACGGRWDAFKDDWNRPSALCWGCGAHERHRAQALLLARRPELLGGASATLHFAPEYCLQRLIEPAASGPGRRYVTGDLDPAGVDLELDLSGLAIQDASFDAVLCSHVLEHVPDDRLAMRELHRITRPGGWCLVMVPLDLARAQTYEDASITTPEGRLAAFWQHDHVRLFAPDIADRLSAAGFEVEVIRPAEAFAAEFETAGLATSDWIFLCHRAGVDESLTPAQTSTSATTS